MLGHLGPSVVTAVVDSRLAWVFIRSINCGPKSCASFAKRDDLKFFLETLCSARYVHEPILAPTQKMLDAYKKSKGAWAEYENRFMALMAERKIAHAGLYSLGCYWA